ncbi:MAG: hypothetical protein QOG93_2495, partial [Gaiellaceae bacterium]|nr:hypothetical protein [Gaiellaceae bacterium]
SPAMVIACVALLLVLGGTGYAASQALPRNSVTSIQVKDHSLLARDFKAGQIPRGPAGVAGPAGPQGPAGPAGTSGSASIKWALVRADGGIAAQSGGITLAAKPSSGTYILSFGAAVSGKVILASGGYAGDGSDQRGGTSAGPCGGGTEGRTCSVSDSTSSVFVQTRNSGGDPADHSFYIAVFG